MPNSTTQDHFCRKLSPPVEPNASAPTNAAQIRAEIAGIAEKPAYHTPNTSLPSEKPSFARRLVTAISLQGGVCHAPKSWLRLLGAAFPLNISASRRD
jgi:hypothetical protein